MHIPDGYLSPQTYIPLYGVFAVAVTVAVKKVKKEVSARDIPYLGMAAAFSFIIMLFNLPVPGGTTGHAVGSAVIALVFGLWVGVFGVSVAIILLGLIFGDGGITAIGANWVNKAVWRPNTTYDIFKRYSRNPSRKTGVAVAAFFSG